MYDAAVTRRSFPGLVLLSLLGLACTGCGTTGGGGFTLFPVGHRLLPSAQVLRTQTPEHLPLPRELDKAVIPDYVAQPGDGLLIEPLALDSSVRVPADQTVLPDGTIDLGKYGRPVVAGRTLDEIESIVNQAVEAEESEASRFNVRLLNAESAVYYVLGEVNAPGSYPYVGHETALDAIVAAGGLSDRAARCKIILSRPTRPDDCRTVLPICYDEIVQLGDTTTNYHLRPGDRIFVATVSCWESLCPDCLKKPTCAFCDRNQCSCGNAIGFSPVQYVDSAFGISGGEAVNEAPPETIPPGPSASE